MNAFQRAHTKTSEDECEIARFAQAPLLDSLYRLSLVSRVSMYWLYHYFATLAERITLHIQHKYRAHRTYTTERMRLLTRLDQEGLIAHPFHVGCIAWACTTFVQDQRIHTDPLLCHLDSGQMHKHVLITVIMLYYHVGVHDFCYDDIQAAFYDSNTRITHSRTNLNATLLYLISRTHITQLILTLSKKVGPGPAACSPKTRATDSSDVPLPSSCFSSSNKSATGDCSSAIQGRSTSGTRSHDDETSTLKE